MGPMTAFNRSIFGRGLWLAAAMLSSTGNSGCIAQMQSDITAQEQRLTALEQDLETRRQELDAALAEASGVLRRNSADQGVQIEELQARQDELDGRIAEMRHEIELLARQDAEASAALSARLDQVARAAGMDVALEESEVPTSKKAHFKAAESALQVGKHSEARALYREYLRRYPDDSKADEAQYALGLSYLRQGQPAAALGEFKKVLANYRSGDTVDDTLLQMSEAFLQVRDCKDAKTALEALLKNHQKSPLASEAKQRLGEISQLPKSQCDA
jgi:TolA-binding protein